MSFISSYKRLEKLCGEVMNDERKVSAYIDKMINTKQGSMVVSGWNEDLKKLKHYRWVRNQIVHEPNCTEENMCEVKDELWIDEFYQRILNCTDPLALYYQAMKKKTGSNYRNTNQSNQYQRNDEYRSDESEVSLLLFVLFILIILFLLFLVII